MQVLELRMSRFCVMDDIELDEEQESKVALKAEEIADKYRSKTTLAIFKGVHDEIRSTIGCDIEGVMTNAEDAQDDTPWSAWNKSLTSRQRE